MALRAAGTCFSSGMTLQPGAGLSAAELLSSPPRGGDCAGFTTNQSAIDAHSTIRNPTPSMACKTGMAPASAKPVAGSGQGSGGAGPEHVRKAGGGMKHCPGTRASGAVVDGEDVADPDTALCGPGIGKDANSDAPAITDVPAAVVSPQQQQHKLSHESRSVHRDPPALSPPASASVPAATGDGAAGNTDAAAAFQSFSSFMPYTPGSADSPGSCITPPACNESGLPSGTPSTGTLSTCDKQQVAFGADAAATGDGWSFDMPTQRCGGGVGSDGSATQPVSTVDAVAAACAPSPNAAAADRSRASETLMGLGSFNANAASPMTPISAAARDGDTAAAATPGSAASCCTLSLSPDFSPHLPLPSVTLLSRETPEVSGCGVSSSDGSSGPSAPQCTLFTTRTENAEGCATPSLGSAAAPAPQGSALMRKLALLEGEMRTPVAAPTAAPRTPLSLSNVANGAHALRGALPGGPVVGGAGTGGATEGQRSGSAARRSRASSAAAEAVTPGSASGAAGKLAASASRPTSASRRPGTSGGDCMATGSGKKPRYLQSTVSSAMKKQ